MYSTMSNTPMPNARMRNRFQPSLRFWCTTHFPLPVNRPAAPRTTGAMRWYNLRRRGLGSYELPAYSESS